MEAIDILTWSSVTLFFVIQVMQNKSSKVEKQLIQSDVVYQALERIKLQGNKCEENLCMFITFSCVILII